MRVVITVSSADPASQSGQNPTPEAVTSDAAAGRSASRSASGYTRFEVIETETVRDALAFPSSGDARLGKWVWYTVGACLLVMLAVVVGVGAAVGAGGAYLVGMAAGMSANDRIVHELLDAAEAGENE